MTIRSGVRDNAFRTHLGISRGTLVKADDSKKMQEVQIRARFGEQIKGVEHWHPYGFTTVPLPPKQNEDEQAEVLLLHAGSNRSHPIVAGIADRRHRPKDLEAGEVQLHDDQKQKLHFKRGVTEVQVPESKKVHIKRVDDSGQVKSQVYMEGDKLTLSHGNTSIVLDGTKIILKGEIHLGDDGGKLIIRKDDVDSGGDTQNATTTKVFAV